MHQLMNIAENEIHLWLTSPDDITDTALIRKYLTGLVKLIISTSTGLFLIYFIRDNEFQKFLGNVIA